MNIYDIIKESYNTDDEIIEEGLFKKVKEIIKGKNKRKDEKDTPSNNNSIKDDKTPYVVKKITSKSMLDKFYKNDAFCIECAPKDPTFPQIIANILNMNYEINTPIEIYFVTGKVFNDVYDLAGDNAYENSVHHAIIPFKVLKNTNDISYAKPQLRSRYFRDVVDNNEYREYIAGRHKKSPQIQWLINAYTNESYYDEGEIIGESSVSDIAGLAFFALMVGTAAFQQLKKIKISKEYVYEMSNKPITKAPQYGYKDAKKCISNYAYYKLHIRNAEKNTLVYKDKSSLNKNVYLYKFNNSNLKLVYKGSFENLCEKYKINLKPMNKSKLKDRDKVYNQVLKLVKEEIKNYKELNRHAKFITDIEQYGKYINGLDDTIDILYCDVHDIVKNPRDNMNEVEKIGYNAINAIIKTVNAKLPDNYKLTNGDPDWDDLIIELRYTGKMNESYYDEDELHDNNLLKEENTMSMTTLANLARDAGLENLLIESDIIKEYDQVIDSLDTISKSKIAGDISVLPVYESDKLYYTDLETLYTVSEVYDVELYEAMKLLKEVNDLSEDTNISVALKEGFENYTTLEEFVELKEALNEAGIDLAWNKELSDEDFITEAGKISDFMDKVKDKIKNMRADSLEKSIKKCEESNKKLNEELQKVQKMSKEEADKYAKKQSVKNIAIVSTTRVSAGVAGKATSLLLASNMLIGIPVFAGGVVGAYKLGTKVRLAGKGLVGFNSTTYKKAIKNTIKLNNQTIKQCNAALKAKK